jgi:hypothetical protein
MPRENTMVAAATLWCPSCGAEYQPTATQCSECRVALVAEPPAFVDAEDDRGLVELGQWPRVQAQVLRRRLETAGVSVMIEWSGPASDAIGIILVAEDQAEFGTAVVNEIDVDDEVADNSPHAYVARIEEHLSAAAGLLAELQTQLDEIEADGRL